MGKIKKTFKVKITTINKDFTKEVTGYIYKDVIGLYDDFDEEFTGYVDWNFDKPWKVIHLKSGRCMKHCKFKKDADMYILHMLKYEGDISSMKKEDLTKLKEHSDKFDEVNE